MCVYIRTDLLTPLDCITKNREKMQSLLQVNQPGLLELSLESCCVVSVAYVGFATHVSVVAGVVAN